MRVRKSVSFVRIFPHTYTLIHKDIKDLEGWIEATAPPSLIYYARRDEEIRTTYEKKPKWPIPEKIFFLRTNEAGSILLVLVKLM